MAFEVFPHKEPNPFINLDLHDGTFLMPPPIPPIPGKAMHLGVGVLIMAVPKVHTGSDTGDFFANLISTSKNNDGTILADNCKVVSEGHEVSMCVLPHINLFPFTPIQFNLLWPLVLFGSSSACLFSVSSVEGVDGPVAVSALRYVGFNVACADPVSMPTSLITNWGTVTLGFTWKDFFNAILSYAIQVACEVLAAKVSDKLSKKLKGTANQTGRKLWKKMLRQAAEGALTGAVSGAAGAFAGGILEGGLTEGKWPWEVMSSGEFWKSIGAAALKGAISGAVSGAIETHQSEKIEQKQDEFEKIRRSPDPQTGNIKPPDTVVPPTRPDTPPVSKAPEVDTPAPPKHVADVESPPVSHFSNPSVKDVPEVNISSIPQRNEPPDALSARLPDSPTAPMVPDAPQPSGCIQNKSKPDSPAMDNPLSPPQPLTGKNISTQEKVKPDGTRIIKRSDGRTTVTMESDGRYVTVTRVESDGTVVRQITDRDGTTRITRNNPDGSLVTMHPDGSVVRISADKNTQIMTATDGTVTRIAQDDSKTVAYNDGTIVHTSADRNTETVYNKDNSIIERVKGTDGTTITTSLPDGTLVTEKPDGSITTSRSDGTVELRQPGLQGETVTTTSSDGTVTRCNPDGSQIVKKPDGTVVQTSFDGRVETTANLDGSITERVKDSGGTIRTTTRSADGKTVTTTNPDGSRVVQNPDGSVTHLSSDGLTETTIRADKSIVESVKGADGRTVETITSADGKTITRNNPDGSRVVKNPDGTITETSPDGRVQTISNADGSQVTRIQKDDQGNITGLTVSTENGKVITHYGSDGSITVRDDNAGTITTRTADGKKETVRNKNGDMIETQRNDKGEIISRTETLENGSIVKNTDQNGIITIKDRTKGTISVITKNNLGQETRITTFDNGKVQRVDPDGTVTTTEHGKTVCRSPDGTQVSVENGVTTEMRPDGTEIRKDSKGNVRQKNPAPPHGDGAVVEFDSSSSKTTVTKPGDNNTVVQTVRSGDGPTVETVRRADGTEIKKTTADGNGYVKIETTEGNARVVSEIFQDGSIKKTVVQGDVETVTQKENNGKVIEIKTDKSATPPEITKREVETDGTVTNIDIAGEKTIQKPDGTISKQYSDGKKEITVSPDGSRMEKVTDDNGDVTTRKYEKGADGKVTITQTDPDGTVTVKIGDVVTTTRTTADGRQTITEEQPPHPGGTITEIKKDSTGKVTSTVIKEPASGKIVMKGEGGHPEVRYEGNTVTIKPEGRNTEIEVTVTEKSDGSIEKLTFNKVKSDGTKVPIGDEYENIPDPSLGKQVAEETTSEVTGSILEAVFTILKDPASTQIASAIKVLLGLIIDDDEEKTSHAEYIEKIWMRDQF